MSTGGSGIKRYSSLVREVFEGMRKERPPPPESLPHSKSRPWSWKQRAKIGSESHLEIHEKIHSQFGLIDVPISKHMKATGRNWWVTIQTYVLDE